jgi:hypothetical protein
MLNIKSIIVLIKLLLHVKFSCAIQISIQEFSCAIPISIQAREVKHILHSMIYSICSAPSSDKSD